MKRNIMLLFLSDVKVFGPDNAIRLTRYEDVGETAATNESAMRKLAKDLVGESLDRFFVVATDKVLYEQVPGQEMNHLDFFYQRLQEVFPHIEEITEVIPYKTEASMQEALHNVLALAEHLRCYMRSVPMGDKIVLHADTTGGMRHANMMILDVLRLLEYSGVEIGHIYYSLYSERRVDEVNGIYDLFSMTSGAEEFVNFGSVKALCKFFPEDRRTAVIDTLLAAMNDFAEEVKLCHHSRFQRAIERLRLALENFYQYRQQCNEQDMTNEELLMAQLEPRIFSEYELLLKENADIRDEIRWCLVHDYIQQALTLYVEGVPEWLFTKKVVELTPTGEKIIAKALKERRLPVSLYFYALTQFEPKHIVTKKKQELRDLQEKLEQKTSRQASCLKETRQNLGKLLRQFISCADEDAARCIFEKINEAVRTAGDEKSLMVKRLDECLSMLDEWCSWLQNPVILKQLDSQASADGLYRKAIAAIEERTLSYWNAEDFHQLYGKKKLQKFKQLFTNMFTQDELLDFFISIEYNYAYRFFTYIETGLVNVNIDAAEFRNILNDYGQIKSERNISNHARNSEKMLTATEIKTLMEKCLARLDESLQ